jgi:hypothetical protein
MSVSATRASEIALALRRGAPDHVLDGGFLADVDGERKRPPAGRLDLGRRSVDGAGQLGMGRFGLRRDRHIGAVAGGAQRHRKADAARGAGDEEGFAFEGHGGSGVLSLPQSMRLRSDNMPICLGSPGNVERLDHDRAIRLFLAE